MVNNKTYILHIVSFWENFIAKTGLVQGVQAAYNALHRINNAARNAAHIQGKTS
ncbi:protein of unknown function [Kingella kingae]|nr:protein of unknown function [Kingella kingae]